MLRHKASSEELKITTSVKTTTIHFSLIFIALSALPGVSVGQKIDEVELEQTNAQDNDRTSVKKKPQPGQERQSKTCRIAIGQIVCIDGDIKGNLVRIENAILKAKAQNAEIVSFPEMALRGWVYPDAHKLAHSIPGDDSEALCELARKHRIYMSIGLAEKDGDRLFDSAIFINHLGEILLKHQKINVLRELMTPSYTPGQSVATVDTKFGRVGLLICADTFDRNVLDQMAEKKPGLLLVPYGWANNADAWPQHGLSLKETVRRAARKLGCPVIGTDLVGAISQGPWEGMIYGGQSYACDTEGNVIAKGTDRDSDILVVDVEIQ